MSHVINDEVREAFKDLVQQINNQNKQENDILTSLKNYELPESYEFLEAIAQMQDKNGANLLYYASLKNYRGVVSKLIDAGANPNATYKFCPKPLYTASCNGNLELVQLLIDAKTNVDVKELSTSFTPLHIACDKGHLDIVKLLIEAGADTNAKARNKITPLQRASLRGFTEIVTLLVKNNANVNVKHTFTKTTPLHDACMYNHIETAKALITNGAKIDFDRWNKSPLDYIEDPKLKAELKQLRKDYLAENSVSSSTFFQSNNNNNDPLTNKSDRVFSAS